VEASKSVASGKRAFAMKQRDGGSQDEFAIVRSMASAAISFRFI
jgi:hypothetical protein